MTESMPILSPSEILTQKIIARFIQEGLLPKEYSKDIHNLFSMQTPTPEDWQLLVEKILEFQNKEGKNGQ